MYPNDSVSQRKHQQVNKPIVTRKQLHTRQIHCEGFERSDGLWDIEATLTDTKPIVFSNHERPDVKPGEPIHKMKLVVTLDLDMIINHIAVDLQYAPFALCAGASNKMEKLIGLKIGAGWMREARERVAKAESCTHLMELLAPISTTAYQTMHWALEEREQQKPDRGIPVIINQCHSLASDSPVVKKIWPEFYTGQ